VVNHVSFLRLHALGRMIALLAVIHGAQWRQHLEHELYGVDVDAKENTAAIVFRQICRQVAHCSRGTVEVK
jgi:hypothetical protein